MTTAITAPPRRERAVRWLRSNLFRNLRDSITTVVVAVIALWATYRMLRWVGITGQWEAIDANLARYLHGSSYPRDEVWRLALVGIVVVFVVGLLAGVADRNRRRIAQEAGSPIAQRGLAARLSDVVIRVWPMLVLVAVCLAMSDSAGPWIAVSGALLAGTAGRTIGAALPRRFGRMTFALPFLLTAATLPFLTAAAGWDRWGGLHLTLFLAATSMLACFPLGLLLALGRRSTMPTNRALSVGFIEFFRGVPLVVLILMSDVALGFFFPQDLLPGKVVRVVIMLTIFTAAYVAEIVRGGLQSVPRGQTEAAQALGMSPVRITAFIVLPQALRNVIPALVGQFISLFKDTTLVFIIGFEDVLTVADTVSKQREFGLSVAADALAFAALVFWVGSYTLSRESQRLERKLGVGTR